MKLVEKHILKNDRKAENLCLLSKELYNLANFYLRQVFTGLNSEELFPSQEKAIQEVESSLEDYNQFKRTSLENQKRRAEEKLKEETDPKKREKLEKILEKSSQVKTLSKEESFLGYDFLNFFLKDSTEYKALPSHTSQQVLQLLCKNWLSFFKSIKDWKTNPIKYLGRPRLPKYKEGLNIVIFTNQQCKLDKKTGKLKFPKKVLPMRKTKVEKICEVRIVPKTSHLVLEVVYEKEEVSSSSNSDKFLSIDPGINNLIACTTNDTRLRPFVVNGKIVKSWNQYFNKRKSELQSSSDKFHQGILTKRIKRLILKRECKIEDYFHKASNYVIEFCIEFNIGTIVLGRNKNWKQSSNMGKRNNQNFVSIPFSKLYKLLKYKAELAGIQVIETEESYTSKCSFLDLESLEKKEKYCGRRIKRGLFKSSDGTFINADLNGSYNIGRKVFPEEFDSEGIEGVGLHPIKVPQDFNKDFKHFLIK